MEEAFRSAIMYNYDLSISGGNKKTKYYTSLGYLDQEGVVIGTGLKRYSASINLESQLSDKIRIGVNVKPTLTNQFSFDQSSRSSEPLHLFR